MPLDLRHRPALGKPRVEQQVVNACRRLLIEHGQILDPKSVQMVFYASDAVNQVMKGRGLHVDVYPRRAFIQALRLGDLASHSPP